MSLGNKFLLLYIIFFFFTPSVFTEEKITSAPLLNLDNIKPSFEETDKSNDGVINEQNIKKKKKRSKIYSSSHAILMGLDKITAKSSEIIIDLDKTKKFGPLEIKILKCGKVKINNKIDDIAYMQVKDLTKNENEKVFIFNGWTFSSDPNLTPFDHAIYDLQLVNCFNV
tara:strand:- start:187 stop:693 length:507 start_codon:yes stop_codon:yes gene_type:complete